MNLKLSCTIVMFVLWEWECGLKAFASNHEQWNSGLKVLNQSQTPSRSTQLQNFPLHNTWSQVLGNTPIKPTGHLSRFNRLPSQQRFPVELEVPNAIENPSDNPLYRKGILTLGANYGTYKVNSKTLESNIQVLHLKPQIYWPITSKTSLYSHYQLGFYNDSNLEHQTFSRLEHKLGNAYIAANLFTWNYRLNQELRKGYFSPRQFLSYSGEIGWNQPLGRDMSCQLSVTLGEQSLNAQSSQSTQYRARCHLKVTSNTMLDLGYSLSHESLFSPQNTNSILSQTPSFNIQFKMDF